ncbi:unnamed protein product [Ambrosiozyma monospora]|uniref:Unnamed protein product n=1 Tax=Ambrosiozyma monospora TaxID=43982 RepID=A0ACB5TBJ9_AMBMO|nr:unnamed protein product [Ambrosiozyma monospora]
MMITTPITDKQQQDIAFINSSVRSYSSDKVNEFHDVTSATHSHLEKTMSRLSRVITGQSAHEEKEDQLKLEKLISHHPEVIKKIKTHLEGGEYGKLGPLEQPIDLEKTTTQLKQNPNSDFNPEDPWNYPVDLATEMRLVVFTDDDKDDPRNWSLARKCVITLLLCLICFCVAFNSAVVTGDIEGPMMTFGVSEEVVILTITLFVLGFGFGPLLFAPLSEEIGRNPVYVSTLFVAVIFIIPCADAKNIGTLLVCRLIDGLAFSAPICLIGGNLADMFLASQRGVAMIAFSAAPFLGPVIGPLVGGYIGDNVGWRWIYWVMLIFSGLICALTAFIPETSHTIILKKRAKKLRKITDHWCC